jgi:hypothetical protein
MRSAIFRQSRWAPDTKQTSDSIPTKTLDVHACGLGRAFSRLTAITTHFEGCVKQPSNKYSLSEPETARCDCYHRTMGFVGIMLVGRRGRCRDNFRLCGNRRSARLGRVGSGGLDSARQVVVSRRSVNGDTTEREGREKTTQETRTRYRVQQQRRGENRLPFLLSLDLVVGQIFAKNSKQKLWLFVLYSFDPKLPKMAPGTHNVATNQINRSHCADCTRW